MYLSCVYFFSLLKGQAYGFTQEELFDRKGRKKIRKLSGNPVAMSASLANEKRISRRREPVDEQDGAQAARGVTRAAPEPCDERRRQAQAARGGGGGMKSCANTRSRGRCGQG
ncbi:MAG: hypothetical protein LBB61_02845 [Treponema sp.]|nr:hypothetical protein [Treponema sp.]